MIRVDFSQINNILDQEILRPMLEEIASQPKTPFESTDPEIDSLLAACQPYLKYPNVILIGNGGSRNNAWSFYHALEDHRNATHFEFLSSTEPDLILGLKKRFSPENTLVLAISKSGNNINMIEPLLAFLDYPVLVISEKKENPLTQMAAIKKWTVIPHPSVGGRFSGFTSCALVPAIIMGLDPTAIYRGAQQAFRKYSSNQSIETNDALALAAHCFQLEGKNYSEIFASVYSTAYSKIIPLMVQLIHESTGQKEMGQSIFGDYSPESQHHTNQRLFGGQKNIVAAFVIPENPTEDFYLKVPDQMKSILMDGEPISVLDENSAFESMRFDYQGVLEHCIKKSIPAFTISPKNSSQESIGEFIGFFYYFAYYSALLRRQSPFDQPEVEFSKKISYSLRAKK